MLVLLILKQELKRNNYIFMASIVELTDKQGNVLLPTTVADAV